MGFRIRRLVASVTPSLERGGARLHPFRPQLRNRRFWGVQSLVVLVVAVHISSELLRVRGGFPVSPELLSFAPIFLFLIPVVYAALNFGFVGSLATVLWSVLLAVPYFLVFHEGAELVAEFFQLGVVASVGLFVGYRVERELSAREHAEEAGSALRASESRYRGLFESSPVSVLIIGPLGALQEANPAALGLFGLRRADMEGMTLEQMVGPETAAGLLAMPRGSAGAPFTVLAGTEGPRVYLEPTLTQASNDHGQPAVQVFLRDVTEEQHRREGLRAYAAYMVRAQEEERRRIAQELHDDTVQSLILVCRQLDSVEGASKGLPASVIADVRAARSATEVVVQELRDFAKALRPPTLEDLGLATSMRRLLLDLAERTGTRDRMKTIGTERRLPLETETGLFRIAQEALRNVERHARATRVVVTLAFHERSAELEVANNGKGFAMPALPGELATGGKLGILGMSERAELLGGSLRVRSTRGRGTTVTVSVPAEPWSPEP